MIAFIRVALPCERIGAFLMDKIMWYRLDLFYSQFENAWVGIFINNNTHITKRYYAEKSYLVPEILPEDYEWMD